MIILRLEDVSFAILLLAQWNLPYAAASLFIRIFFYILIIYSYCNLPVTAKCPFCNDVDAGLPALRMEVYNRERAYFLGGNEND